MARGNVKLSIYSTFRDDGTKQAEKAMDRFAKQYGKLDKASGQVKLDGMSAKLAQQSVKWDQLAAKCRKYSTSLNKAAKAFAPFSAAAAAALTGSIKLAVDFERGLAKLATITDQTVMSMQEMGAGLLEVSNNTGIAVTELEEAAYQAQSASVSTANTVAFVEQAVSLSKTGFTDMSTAVDTLTTIINAYKLSEEEAALIGDKLVQTQNKGKLTVDELSQSIGQAIPTAAAYGVNLDNLLSSYVILTKQGINTANATTYLNGMMTELSKGSSRVSKVLQSETGKSFNELMADGRSLGDVMNILYDSVGGDSTAFANLWGNVRAGRGALALANVGTTEFNRELAGMAGSAGTMGTALGQLETPAVKAQKAINSLKNAGIQLGQQALADLSPIIDKLVKSAKAMADRFSSMSTDEKELVVRTLAVTAAVAPMLKLMATGFTVVGKFAGGMGKLTAKLAAVSASGGRFSGMAGKLGSLLRGPVVLGIMAAVAAIALIAKKLGDWHERTKKMEKATKGLEKAMGTIKPSVRDAVDAYETMGEAAEGTAMSVDDLIDAQAELADTIAERNRETSATIGQLEAARSVIDQYANSTGLTAEEQGRLQAALQLVNDECGTQYELTDAANGVIRDQTGAIVKNTDAIDENIAAKTKQLKVEAASENLKDLYKQQAEAVQTVTDAENELAAAKDARRRAEGGSAQAMEKAIENEAKAQRRYDESKAALDALNGSIKKGEKQLGILSAETGKAGVAMTNFGANTRTKGASAVTKMAQGILSGKNGVFNAAKQVSNKASAGFEVDGYSIGKKVSDDFKRGIINGLAGGVSGAVQTAVDTYMSTLRRYARLG